ncbi:MAG: hypothetical protein HWD59_03695 [Coxiellaceae bacterium]|nr:MAG: hypothetical protein HWD59_03695 [Coxiellaceae bacterium]
MNPRVNLLHYSIARSYLFNSPLNEERAILHLSLVLNDRQTSALLAYCCKLLLQNMAEHHRNEFIRYKAATNLVQAYLNEAAKQPINFCKKIILDKAAKYLSPFNVEYDDVQTQDLKTRITSALAELHQKNDRGYIKSMLESPSHLLDIDAKLKAKDQKSVILNIK